MKFTLTKSLTTALLLLSMQAGAQSANSNESYNFSEEPQKSLTIGLVSVFSGYFPLYYERRINPFMSIQGGAGITFRSLVNDVANSFFNPGKRSGNYQIPDYYSDYKHRKAQLGFYFEVSSKFYPKGKCMNGFYLSPMLEFKRYNYKAQELDVNKTTVSSNLINTVYTNNYQNEYRNCLDFTLNIGGHLYSRTGFTRDWNFGLGIRYQSTQRQDMGQEIQGNTAVIVNGVRKTSGCYPILNFNVSLGY